MAEESSISGSSDSASHEGIIRSTIVSVPAISRLRSMSGTLFAPSGCGRVRRESGPSSTNGTNNLTSSASGGGTSPRSNMYVRTELLLTNTSLYYEAQNWRREILLEDLIGVQINSKPPSNNPNACQVDVHYYPLVVNRTGKNQGRNKLVMSVQFDTKADLNENVLVATDWKKAICLESYRAVRREFYFSNSSSMESSEDESTVPPRRLLVFVNPVGGQGKAVKEFEQHVQPLFDLAEIEYTTIITERQNHARDFIKEFNVSSVDGIVISSGDGLLYEVINGMMEREDWETAIKTPIGMLPTGSGNALSASVIYEADEQFSLINAAFQIIKGGVIPMDIATVQTSDGYKCYMSLLANWGLVADADIESERFRKIGPPRFVLGALNCIIKKRLYVGKVSYLPFDEEQDQQTLSIHDPTSSEQAADNRESSNGHDDQVDTGDDLPGQQNGKTVVLDTIAQLNGDEIILSDDGDIHDPKETTKDAETTSNEVVSQDQSQDPPPTTTTDVAHPSKASPDTSLTAIMTKCPYGPNTDLLPALSDPVPSNWKTVEKEFLSVTVLMIPHMSNEYFGDPSMSIGTERLRLVFVEYAMTRMNMLSMLMVPGSHLSMSNVSCIDCKAYRLEPDTPVGLLTVDGESVPYGAVQSQVHSGLARVMCRKRRT